MTALEVFFYVVLPVVIVGAGWVAVRANEHHDHRHPGAAE